MQGRNKIDEFLDQALGEFSHGTPREALEERILAKLRKPKQIRWTWAWVAIPAFGVILLIALLWSRAARKDDVANLGTPPVISKAEPVHVFQRLPLLPMTHVRNVRDKTPRPSRSTAKPRDPEPRLATFPSQDGNDELLRLALRFAEAHPDVAGQIAKEQKEFREVAAAFTAPLSGTD